MLFGLKDIGFGIHININISGLKVIGRKFIEGKSGLKDIGGKLDMVGFGTLVIG